MAHPPSDAPRQPPIAQVPGDALARALFEQSPLSTVVYDVAGHIRVANGAFERLFGLRVGDIPGSYSILHDPQLEAQGAGDDVRRAFAGEAVTLPPVRYVATPSLGVTTTTWTQAHLYPVRDAAGVVTEVVLVHMDLTARVEAEEALRASDARLRVAVEAGRMGTWEWNVAEDRVHWSPTMERIHGLQVGTFGGTFDEAVRDVHPDDRAHVEATIRRTLDGEPHELTYRIVVAGDVRWLATRGHLVRDGDGRPERLVGIATDVTDARRAEEATRLLAETGAVLAASLDYEAMLSAVAALVVPALADFCIVDLLGERGDALQRVATAHADPAVAAQLAAVREAPPLDGDGLVARAVRTGEIGRAHV